MQVQIRNECLTVSPEITRVRRIHLSSDILGSVGALAESQVVENVLGLVSLLNKSSDFLCVSGILFRKRAEHPCQLQEDGLYSVFRHLS